MNNNRPSWRLWVYLLAASVSVFLTTALAASAQNTNTQKVNDYGLKSTAASAGLPTGTITPATLASTIITILLSLIGVLMVILVIYSGFIWMTAEGNEEKVGRAKKILSGAIIGTFIILSAYAIAQFVITNLVKVSTSNNPSSSTQTTTQCTPAGTGKAYAGCASTCAVATPNEYSGTTNCVSPQKCCTN